MTMLETFAVDISDLMHKAAEADKDGDVNKALTYLEQVAKMHQQCYYETWMKYHTSGAVA